MSSLVFVFGAVFAVVMFIDLSNPQSITETDLESTLDCNRRTYSHKVTQTDSEGRACWGMITVVSCWGRCDSNEVIKLLLFFSYDKVNFLKTNFKKIFSDIGLAISLQTLSSSRLHSRR